MLNMKKDNSIDYLRNSNINLRKPAEKRELAAEQESLPAEKQELVAQQERKPVEKQ